VADDVEKVSLGANVSYVDCVLRWIGCISRERFVVNFIYIVIYDYLRTTY
jgi:hypothetical protein